ncbi:sodium/proton antiporter, NhaA family (TC 2.A.33.1.1) [Malonomonas rubra DSM 5091]|uniref:Na(+)/H(+) antiporter NhaA n=1 Tax=Malonomonas rubra DSM 5091 TaxID=1122189 RepID=A0A1M6KRD6_MALRU|nr:Na+/H+ antiporter NhaA [Malonomonas rubra]SHJ61523.1 sodium/proton antiporter, NhaA family (TC 2.A.33.1.1) [Malonomonas rubra DSM 5091]
MDFEDLAKGLAELKRPFESFLRRQASGGIVLLAATFLALVCANSPLRDSYHHFWETTISIGADSWGIKQSLHHWINDGLMAIFFFVVGLELKREFLAGELNSLRKATLPVLAALGGMLVPALIYILMVSELPEAKGWGVPMATDIAFALGVIALLGKRIPRSLAIFLTALAIVDDLGAVVVIALFYSKNISVISLMVAGGLWAVLFFGNRAKIQHPAFYALIGFGLWLAMLKSGIHPSIAGVMIGATIPIHPRYSRQLFLEKAEHLLALYRKLRNTEGPFVHERKIGTLLALESLCHDALSPLQRMEHEMHRWVIFGIMPLFAFANAGVSLSWAELQISLTQPVTLGIIGGLFIGKPLGIFLFSRLAVALKLAELPQGTSWYSLLGVGILGGIGFTMSIFITNLAFFRPELISQAKVGIFIASLLAGVVGYLLLRRVTVKKTVSSIDP